jgi:hypothetical protein
MSEFGDAPILFLRDQLHGRNERVVYYSTALQVFRFTKEKSVLLITESSISLYPFKTLQKGAKPCFACDCFSVTQVEARDARTVALTVDSVSISLDLPWPSHFVQHLYLHLRTILTSSEMPRFILTDFQLIEVPIPDADRIISRLRARAFLRLPHVPEDFELTLRNLITYGNTLLDFARFPYPDLFDFILDALIFATQVNAISLPYSLEPHWAGLAVVFRRNPWIRTIATAEVVDDSFDCIAEKVPDPLVSNIQHITIKTLLRSRHIAVVSQLCNAYRIPSVTISNCHSESHVSIILKTLTTIRSLTLDHVEGFDHYDSTLRPNASLEELGITYSSVNLTWFLVSFERHNLRIKRLNLSGNHTARAVVKPFAFPESFERFIANDVEFQPESFVNIFRALLEVRTPLSVSLSYLRGMPPEDIEISFQAIITRAPSSRNRDSITEFLWDENPVTPSLVQLLERLLQLEILSVRGISNESAVLISGYLRRKPPVRELRIGGTRVGELQIEGFVEILRAMKEGNRTVQRIDVKMVTLNDVTQALAGLLLGNRVIQELMLDCCNLQDADDLIRFLESLLPRGVPLIVQLPPTDMEWMSRARIMVAEVHGQLTRLVKELAAGDPAIVAPPETLELPAMRMASEEEEACDPEDTEDVEVTRPPRTPDAREWEVEIDRPPPRDNAAIWANFREEFSFPALLSQIPADPM